MPPPYRLCAEPHEPYNTVGTPRHRMVLCGSVRLHATIQNPAELYKNLYGSVYKTIRNSIQGRTVRSRGAILVRCCLLL